MSKSIPDWVFKLKDKAKEKRKVNLVESYLENSTLHGVKYIVLRQAKWYQKTFWIVMLCLSTAACSQQMYRIWKKWEESPIILSFGNNMKSLSEIPFPAVTICIDSGLNKAIVDVSKNMTSLERVKLQHLAQLTCGTSDKKSNSPDTFNVSQVVDFLKLVSAPLDMSVSDCKYRTVSENCRKLFSPVLIDRGLCYTFNGLANDEIFREGVRTIKWWEDKNETFLNKWSLENGYELPEDDIHVLESLYPFVALDVGADFGLNIKTTSTLLHIVNNCPKVANGFKIILHNPVEFPHARRISYRSNVNADVSIFVRPEYITTPDEPVLYIEPTRRKCYFSDERQLKYFRYYTQDNCAVECLTNVTLQQCQCVAFYMPTTTPVPICSATNQCFRNVTKLMVKNQIEKTVCSCLPACTELSYTVENSHTYSSETTAKSSISNNTGSVNVVFTEAYFITKERKELYGKTEFLSNCGGTLGLFLGFSVLSLVEVIYYISLYFSNKRRILLSQAPSMASLDITQIKRRQTL
ncbi:pickpocket protein 28 isoform X2 [Nilaparvata lugens]|nr:pickpocket protein 28 isoform X2 [Nilaparvata lugens]